MLKKILKYIGLGLLLLVLVLVVKTFYYSSKQVDIDLKDAVTVPESAIQNLTKAIQFKTISREDKELNDTAEFAAFHRFIETTYPLASSMLEKQIFHNYALLYKWQGSDSELKPVVLMAHQDVVPVVEKNWEQAPFSGLNDGTFIWGRGTLDDKGSLISILEAVEQTIALGIIPKRTIYLAFGDDEEVGGKGAKTMAAYLKSQGIKAEMVLDEGMVISSGIVPMLTLPVATIGTSEKGYLTVKLSCEYEGGHSSMPLPETAISVLSKAVVKITDNRPAPRFTQPVNDFMSYIGPEIPWPARIVFANKWLLGGILKSIYTGSGAGNASVRTTTAPTMLQAGIKDNILPTEAFATVNYRLLPGDTKDKMLAYLTDVIDDERIKIEAINLSKDPALISPVDNKAFLILNKTIKESFEKTLVAPTLMLASSDSYHYSEISKNVYRFAPYQLDSNDLARIHGDNERITIENYKKMIGFYFRLLENIQKDF